MGCKPSKLQIQNNGSLYNENTDIRKKFLVGVNVSRENEGIEGGIQIAFATTRSKKYECVSNPKPTALTAPEEIQISIEPPEELISSIHEN